jgi:hypothetical protein
VKNFLKRKWAVCLVVLAVVLVGIGIAVPVLAQTGNPPVNVPGGVYLDQPTLERLATALGLTPAELTGQLQAGGTLATIAGEKEIATATLVEAIVAPHVDQLALQVKYGYLTEEQAQAVLQTAREQASLLLEQSLSARAGYNGGRGQCGGYSGDGQTGPGCGSGGITGPGMMGGWGGIMGPGMMRGWGGASNNPGTVSPGQTSNRGTGWGMMGRW